MSLSGRTVSCKEVIGELYKDRKYKYELQWADAVEWCVSAIELIGAPQSLTPRAAKIAVSNYRAMLPCDLHYIMQAAGSTGGCVPFPMRGNTNTFHAVFTCDDQLLANLINDYSPTTSTVEPIGVDISGNPVYEIESDTNWAFPEATTDPNTSGAMSDPTYSLSDNHIFTNFESGYVFLAYMALPVDDEGYPTIPDNRRFKEAVKTYIGYKIDYILYRSKELDKEMYDISEREWLFYVASAGNVARVPNYDQAQSLLNQMKLIPQRYSHNNMFKTLGS